MRLFLLPRTFAAIALLLCGGCDFTGVRPWAEPMNVQPVAYGESETDSATIPAPQLVPASGELDSSVELDAKVADLEAETDVATPPPLPAEEQSGTGVTKEPFRPPFAERTDLFSPPRGSNSGEPGPDGEAEAPLSLGEVSLKGFARVRERRVLLMIEDSIAALQVGQEQQGIRVIAIEPPKVTLERDEQQWTLSLSNQIGQAGEPRPRRNPLAD